MDKKFISASIDNIEVIDEEEDLSKNGPAEQEDPIILDIQDINPELKDKKAEYEKPAHSSNTDKVSGNHKSRKSKFVTFWLLPVLLFSSGIFVLLNS